jgi:hypothetical protein
LLKAIAFIKQNNWLKAYAAFNNYDQHQELTNADYLHSYALAAIRIGFAGQSYIAVGTRSGR